MAKVTYNRHEFEGYTIFISDDRKKGLRRVSETIIHDNKGNHYHLIEPFMAAGFYEMFIKMPKYRNEVYKFIKKICVPENKITLMM